jgi:UDP-perosamine 4-acetyltransferase
MREKVIIIGAGGHGKVVLEILQLSGDFGIAGFIDADSARQGERIELAGQSYEILGAINQIPKLKKQGVTGAVVAIGDNRIRMGYALEVKKAGLKLISAIHPQSLISPTAKLGENLCIAAGAIIGTEALIGDSCIINTGAILDHECRVGEGVHIAPGAVLAGRVTIESRAFIGMGSRILPCLTIGQNATVGAGAVVIADVPGDATVVGIPAKAVQK